MQRESQTQRGPLCRCLPPRLTQQERKGHRQATPSPPLLPPYLPCPSSATSETALTSWASRELHRPPCLSFGGSGRAS